MKTESQYKRCWVIGAGVMGTALAAFLHGQGLMQTHLVGSSPHLRAIKKQGLRFEAQGQEPQNLDILADLPEDVPRLGVEDLVILAGKATGLETVAKWLAPKLPPLHPVIAMQNGMGFEDGLAEALNCSLERGLFFMGAISERPGQVKAFPKTIALENRPACQALAFALQGCAVNCELARDFKKRAWSKLAVNCVANPLAGILDSRNFQLMHESLDKLKQAILDEVIQVARAEGVEIGLTAQGWNDYVTPENSPSLRIDLKRGVLTEIDFLNGAVVRFGCGHGIDTTVNRMLVEMVHFLENKPAE
jgi:2-dehydropantoate 2-reductase